ncbi:glycosyltransferase family 4 protein [Geminicoccus roseus]|uniref:glycosyltransferase family 4 protein n=1 Tax=Geminicoccus roseus TaxID=404900 RepID=UPI00041524B1|nr:glycosyltransferase family 4 protein [Geminicoccus roseus]
MPELVFAIPGDPERRTGGYLYDRRLSLELAALGWAVSPLRLPDGFPFPSPAELEETDRLLAGIPDGRLVMVDGLAFGAMPDIAVRHAGRLALVALVHHPLGYETGLEPDRAQAMIAAERSALAHARRVLVTSTTTRAALLDQFAVPASSIAVALPGTDPAPLAQGSGGDAPALLAVGSILPRKDFPALIEALRPWRDLPWTLTIGGSLLSDPKEAARLRHAIEASSLAERVELAGEVDTEQLATLLHQSDLFVSSSRYEGFGMALAEAVARALPVVAVAGGAVAEWMDSEAAMLVPPDHRDGLSKALGLALSDPERRARMREAALAARKRLPSWAETARTADALLHEAHP